MSRTIYIPVGVAKAYGMQFDHTVGCWDSLRGASKIKSFDSKNHFADDSGEYKVQCIIEVNQDEEGKWTSKILDIPVEEGSK